MHAHLPRSTKLHVVCAAALTVALLPTIGWAGGEFTQTFEVDPSPNMPGSGDEVTVTVRGEDTAVGRADVVNVAAAIEQAVDASMDMRDKIGIAGSGHGFQLEYLVTRDNPDIEVGFVKHDSNVINIDVGDIEEIANHLSEGSAASRQKVADDMLTHILAHETEHAKDDADDVDDNGAAKGNDETDHRDLDTGGKADKGPAVEDENTVATQMGTGVQRKQYGFAGRLGTTLVEWTVDGDTVIFDYTSFHDARGRENKFVAPVPATLDPSDIEIIPGVPCGPGITDPCFPDVCGPGTADGDCDTIGAGDNCPDVANPSQADHDDDGTGSACAILELVEPDFTTQTFPPGVGAKGLEPSPGGVWGDFLYVADSSAGVIERMDANDNMEVFATGRNFPVGMAFLLELTPEGGSTWEDALYVAEFFGNEITKFDPSGNVSSFTSFAGPGDLAFDPTGAYGTDMFATTAFTGPIETVDPNGSSTPFSDIAGTYLNFGPGGAWGTGLYSTEGGPSATLTLTLTANAPIADSAAPDTPGPVLTLPVTFPESRILTDVDILVKVTHPNIGDLVVSVEHPDGTTVDLWDRKCNTAQFQDIDTTFDDDGTAYFCNPGGPTPDPGDGNGNFIPQGGPLSVFDNKDAIGQWKLHVTDNSPGNVGTVDEWSLRITESGTGISSVHADGSHDLVARGFVGPEGFDWAFGPGWNGDMFATDVNAGEIHRVQSDGTRSLFAKVPGAADVAFWHCALYVVSADGGCWKLTSDSDDGDQDGHGDFCDNCAAVANPAQGPAVFPQSISASSDKETFFWSSAADVTYVRGDLAMVSTYAVNMVQSLAGVTSFADSDNPAGGYYYVVKPDCQVGNYQTQPGAEPGRDALP